MKILVFAGTSEGHALAQFLSAHKLPATVCVATEYGEMVLPELPYITVHCGRLTPAQMQTYMTADTLVIDATHPYADAVTQNIQAACQESGAEYLRLLRPQIPVDVPVVCVPDTAAAAAYLNTVTGSVLLTTGSKELQVFTAVERYAQRLYARVLPTSSVLQKCEALGFSGSHILAMQGPFSKEMNLALLRMTQASYLVTKDTGTAGGFSEKLEAAKETNTTVVLIARPTKENGYPLLQVQQLLTDRFALQAENRIDRFPLFVSLKNRKCVVIGAGKIGLRRADSLRSFGAQVTVIAPEGKADIARQYTKTDITGAFLVVAATNIRDINQQIARDCAAENILCSVADCAAESSFYFPAICQGNGLIAGIVSDGSNHAATAKAAAQIRSMLQQEGGEGKK